MGEEPWKEGDPTLQHLWWQKEAPGGKQHVKDGREHELSWGGKNPFSSALYLVCFRCENAVINVELAACLKIVLHLLLLFPWVTKAIVYFSRWKRSCEKLFTGCRREHRGRGPGSMLMSGVGTISAIANTRSFFSRNLLELKHQHVNLGLRLSGHAASMSISFCSLPNCTRKTQGFFSCVTE